jgi:bis(5'-nucleosyl)-tetraphosphatase (symmetrical)
VARIAIGDVQGCLPELRRLVSRIGFSVDRDELWFVGDLVNRGPDSLGVLRFVRSLGDNARVVLGNHDLHLLAVVLGGGVRRLRGDDTLDEVLAARDRDTLVEWLLRRPLAIADATSGDLMVHAGLVPAWSAAKAMALATEVGKRLQDSPGTVLAAMYGNRPERWTDALVGSDRDRFVINALTRLRFCRNDGSVDMKLKGRPGSQPEGWVPWFDVPGRASEGTRVIFGHWSTLGLLQRPQLLGLDSGCVWGGALTARSLDDERCWQEPCAGYQSPDGD